VNDGFASTVASLGMFDLDDDRCAARIKLRAGNWAKGLCVPAHFLELLLLIEDKRFPVHMGIDLLAMLRSLRHNLFGGSCLQGASTITQQIYNIRNVDGEQCDRRTYRRKIKQVAFALVNHRRLSKFVILQEYLGTVYWGRDFFGIAAAANGYFEVPPVTLDVEQSFLLAERLACPNRFSSARVRVILSRRSIRTILESNSFSYERLVGYYERIGFTVEVELTKSGVTKWETVPAPDLG